MTTLALNPKQAPKINTTPEPQEIPDFEMSPADETKNRGRKIKEIKKALKSMKKISRGTVEDKERIAKLEAILEHYVKEHKQQLSERYKDEFLNSKATIPSIITKLPKAIGLSVKKIGTCIDQIKISKTHKERAYNFFETMKSIGQTVATPVVYAGKFIVDNWYLSLLVPVLKPDLFENLINKAKDLINGNGVAEVIETPSIEQAITETTVETVVPTDVPVHNELPAQIPNTGPQPVAFGISEETVASPAVTGTQTVEFPDQIDMEALMAEGNAINVDAQVAPAVTGTQTVEFPDQIDMEALMAEGNAIEVEARTNQTLISEISTNTVNDTNVEYGTLIDHNEVEHNVPLVTIDPIEAEPIVLDPIQEQGKIVDEALNSETNQNVELATNLAENPAEVGTEEPKVNEETSEDDKNYNLPNNNQNYNVFTLGPWCPLLVLPNFNLNQPTGEILASQNTITETVKKL